MLEILQFVFSSFWVWLGFVIILAMLIELVGNVFNNILRVILYKKSSKDLKETEEEYEPWVK